MVVVLSLASLGLGSCNRGSSGAGMPQRPAAPVTVAMAATQAVPIYLDEIGTTMASAVVNIQSQVTGQIIRRNFEDGQDLAKGAVLFEIDPRPFQDVVKQAEANLAQAQAQVALNQADYNHVMQVAPSGGASAEDVITKEGALNSAKATLLVNQAMLNTAQLNLSYCTITSPIDGRAGRRLVDAGNLVKANDATLVTIQTLAPLYADFTITEGDLPGVREKMNKGVLKAEVSMPGRPNDARSGDLTFLDTQVQPNAGRVMMRTTLPNKDLFFWPGQFVNVRLILDQIPQAVLVPYACVQIAQQGSYVYVVADGKARLQPVTLGQRQGDLVVVEKGVAAGEQVVETGQLAVTPGERVRILDTPTSGPAMAGATEGMPSKSGTPNMAGVNGGREGGGQ
jgi:multidrug efflux system membrane fusion protein